MDSLEGFVDEINFGELNFIEVITANHIKNVSFRNFGIIAH